MKKYVYKLEIVEGSDGFFESLSLNGTGCEQLTELLEQCLFEYLPNLNRENSKNRLTLVRYSNSE